MDTNLAEDLVAANRILAEHGVIDAYGHVSIRSPGDPGRYWLARSIAPELVVVDDMMEYDLDSTPIDPRGRESVRERGSAEKKEREEHFHRLIIISALCTTRKFSSSAPGRSAWCSRSTSAGAASAAR